MPDYAADQMYRAAVSAGADHGTMADIPEIPGLVLPPAHLELQRAAGVAMAAAAAGQFQTPDALRPNYLRLSQAERERLSKMNGENQKLKGDS